MLGHRYYCPGALRVTVVALDANDARRALLGPVQSSRPNSGTADDSGRHWPETVGSPGSHGGAAAAGAVVANKASLGQISVRWTAVAACGASSCSPWLPG